MFVCLLSSYATTQPTTGIPRAFDSFSCPGAGGREFDHLSLPGGGPLIGGGEFDRWPRFHVIFPRGLTNHGGDKLFAFVADWLKSKGPHKLCSVFEGIKNRFILSLNI